MGDADANNSVNQTENGDFSDKIPGGELKLIPVEPKSSEGLWISICNYFGVF